MTSIMRVGFVLLLGLVLASVPAGAQSAPRRRVTLIAAGDLMVYQAVKRTAREQADRTDASRIALRGWDAVLEDIAPRVREADLGLVNIETPMGPAPVGDPWFLASGAFPLFKAPTELASAVAWAGFDVANVANNHALDQGTAGVRSTLRAVGASGMLALGAGLDREDAETLRIVHRHGMRIGLLGAAEFLNEPRGFDRHVPQVALLDAGRLARWVKTIKEMRGRVDVLVLTIHWGEEDSSTPRQRERQMARSLCEAGVDVILGHHSHVLQPVEWLSTADGRRCVVAYSLGNLVAASADDSWRRGVLLEIGLERCAVGAAIGAKVGGRTVGTRRPPLPSWAVAGPVDARSWPTYIEMNGKVRVIDVARRMTVAFKAPPAAARGSRRIIALRRGR